MNAQFQKGDHVAWQKANGYYDHGKVVEASTHWVTIQPFSGGDVVVKATRRVLPD